MTQRRSCCRRAAVPSNPRDFCGSLATSTGVTLVENSGRWEILVLTPGGQAMNLSEALVQFQCRTATTGTKLAEIVVNALQTIVAAQKQHLLREKAGRQMPILMLKDFLLKASRA